MVWAVVVGIAAEMKEFPIVQENEIDIGTRSKAGTQKKKREDFP